MDDENSLDSLDRNLLRQLQDDSRTSVALLARRLGVARTTVIARVGRMERLGVIAGYGVRIGREFSDMGTVAKKSKSPLRELRLSISMTFASWRSTVAQALGAVAMPT